MRFADFFSGIGGFHLGMESAGHECVYSCEIDKFCREVQRVRFGQAPSGEDIQAVDPADIPAADVWCGGWPCQGNSVAGKRGGILDPRSGLIGRFLDLVEARRPDWLFLENVPGALSVNGGKDWEAILGRMAQLGYVGAWRILDAQYFGVPQRRRRVFIVARRAGAAGPHPSEVLLEPEGVRGSAPAGESSGTQAPRRARGGIGVSVAGTLQSHHPRNAPDDALCVVGGVYQCRGGNVGPLGAERRGNGGLTGGVPFVAGTLGGGPGRGWRNDLDGCGAFIPVAATIRASDGHHGFSSPRGDGADNEVVGPSPFVIKSHNGCAKETHAHAVDVAACVDGTGGYAPGQGGTVIVAATRESGGHPNNNAATGRRREDDENLVIAFDVSQVTSRQNGSRCKPGAPAPTLAAQGRPHVAFVGADDVARPLAALAAKGISGPDGSDTLVFAISAETGQGADLMARPITLAPTVIATDGAKMTDRGVRDNTDASVGHKGVRRLTPLECERLQGFPDGWTNIPGASDASRYRSIGNAVAVPVIEWIARRLLRGQADGTH